MTIILKNNKEYEIFSFVDNVSYNDLGERTSRIVVEVKDELSFEEMVSNFTNDNISEFKIIPKFSEKEVLYSGKSISGIDYRIEDNGIKRIVYIR